MALRARIHFLLALALLLTLTVPAMGREQKVLQKSLTDTQARAADAWLDQALPTTNHGADTTLQVRSLATSQNQRALVRFDLSSIPRSGIKAGTLALFMSTVPTGVRTYNVGRVTSLWTETPDVTWNNRLPSSTTWNSLGVCPPNCGGGDFSGVTTSAATPGAPGTMSWTITSDVQKYFGGAPPVGNYGAIISDSVEEAVGPGFLGVFASKEDATVANRPKLTVDFIQQVTALTAVPGIGLVTLSWTYPAAVSGGTVVSATDGVVVLRRASAPVAASTIITDGTLLTNVVLNLCATVGTGTVVFKSGAGALPTLATGFTDTGGACPPANGTTYYYKVFVRDAANAYSASGADSSFVSEIMATPNATAATQENAVWMAPTGAATFAPPGIMPLTGALITSNSSLVQGVSLTNGSDIFAPASTGGAMSARPPALDAATSSTGSAVTYLANQDNFVYAVNASTGQILWLTNPTGGVIANNFMGGAAVHVNSISPVSCIPPSAHDLVIVGTNAVTLKNQIVGIDGNTGAVVWSVIGSVSQTQALPSIGTTSTTPFVDYMHCVLWVATTNFGSKSPPVTGTPSLWKITPQTGALLGTANVLGSGGGGGDINASPTLTRQGEVLFISNENADTYAMSPTLVSGPTVPTITQLVTTPPLFGDTFSTNRAGPIKGFPLVLGTSSPFTIVYSRNVTVHGVSFDRSTNTFTELWATDMPGLCNPSSVVGFFEFSFIYVGCSDGKLYELNLASGTVNKTRNVNTGAPATVGDPSLILDEVAGVPTGTGTIIVGASDGHVYAFKFPF